MYSIYMLAYKNRFHGYGSLKYVYTHGRSARSRLIAMKFTENPKRKTPRVAVVVSKKVLKGAVGRNRIRRRIYEAVRRELPRVKPSHDIVLNVFSAEVLTVDSDDLVQMIRQMFTDANLYLNNS